MSLTSERVPRSLDSPKQPAPRKSLAASTVGQLLEWFEWSAYAVFAPFIAQVMFNPANPVSALLSTLAVFAVGFLVRPLGGVVFGAIADRRGRKFVLVTTMLSMAAASVMIGFMPTYEAIGVWASVGLLVARMIQGFAHGGESATANSYVAEIAPRHRRGQWGSIVFVAIFGGSIIAYTLGGAITNLLDETQVLEWGWRIPFLMGAGLAIIALYMRRGMAESVVHQEAEGLDDTQSFGDTEQAQNFSQPGDVPSPVAATGRSSQFKAIVLIVAMIAGITSAHYTWSSYVSTYAIVEQGMAPSSAYWATVAAQVIALISLPFWGRLSDKVGRKPVLYFFGIGMIVAQFPLMAMITDQGWTLFIAAALALLIVSASGALLSCVMSEVFPTKFRTRNIGLAYSLSVAVFGGSAPYLNQLAQSVEMPWLSSVYIVVLCLVTVVAIRKLPETRGIDLNSVR
ncbi:MFS transporter [Nesterenkonia aerolata]|uniref:MFS transporter n=1 Tax=Nesterenkonia aerolata TaxID=3074079 RepID=A0ABU2DPR5_9MICC|nr:MFS transporter [Nesterenkonia sp. LY-0111]MDR8018386.1 MFS transporter [Nesterenkonia sp. LY-0111]